MILLKNILVATDFSDASEAALTYGRALATQFDATLHVLHVCENVLTRALGGEAYIAVFPDIQRDVEETARRQLDAIVMNNDPAPTALRVKPALLTSNTPAMAIVGYAAESGIDLIVMGTHGRGAVAHLLMGSVAERVVRTAPCPVLTVRRPEHDFVTPDTLVGAAQA